MRPVHAIAGLLLASLAVGLAVLALGWTSSALPDDPEEHLALLIETLGEYRPLEARLVGFDHWAPCETPDVGPIQPDTLLPEDVLPRTTCSTLPEAGTAEFEAIWALEPPSGAPESVALLRLQAVWDLVWRTRGDSGRAVQKLERAVELRREEVGNETEDSLLGELWSDLSAAYLARAEDGDDPLLDLALALDAATRSLSRAPDLPAASFNRALALGKLRQTAAERDAWTRLRVRSPDDPFASEIQARLDRSPAIHLHQSWNEGARANLERAIRASDDPAAAHLVETHAELVRSWIDDEVLPAWGAAELSGDRDTARRQLDLARVVGRHLRDAVGDRMTADAVAGIETAGITERAALARGHVALQRAMAAYRRQAFAESAPLFETARDDLTRGGSPHRLWAELQLAIHRYYGSTTVAYLELSALRDRIDAERHPYLAGRVEWMLGLTTAVQDRFERAEGHYRRGIEIFDRLGSAEAGTLRSYLATLQVQDPHYARRLRFQALIDLERLGDPRQLYNSYSGLAFELAGASPALGRSLADRILDEAERWGEPIAQADARILLAELFQTPESLDFGLELLAEAEEWSARVEDSELRGRLIADHALALGRTLRAAGRFAEADERLASALERYEAAGHTRLLPELLENQAEVRAGLGDTPGAVAALERAVDHLARSLTDDELSRADAIFSDQATQLDRLGHRLAGYRVAASPWAALEAFDSVRVGGYSHPANPRTARRNLPSAPPPGRLVVATLQTSERLYLFLDSRSTGRTVLQSDSLDTALQTLQHTLAADPVEGGDFQDATAPFYEALVRPALNHDPEAAEVVFVPDGDLVSLPWLGLYDDRTGLYLTDLLPVSLATSLGAALADDPPAPKGPMTALAVGGDGFDSNLYDDLEPLSAASEEAVQVAAIYGNGTALAGSEATSERIAQVLRNHRPRVVSIASHLLIDPTAGGRPSLLVTPSTKTTGIIDLAALDFPGTELLFLSACRGGDFGALGRILAMHDLPVGVGNLLPVDDHISALMGTIFHRYYQQDRSPATSLQRAVADLRTTNLGIEPKVWSWWSVLRQG